MFHQAKIILCMVGLIILSSFSASGDQTFILFKKNRRIGKVEISSRVKPAGFETTTRIYYGKNQTNIHCIVDENWNLVSVSLQESLAHKVFHRSEVKSDGKRISIDSFDAKDKKIRSELGVHGIVIPKTALYLYFATIKNPEVNVPHEIQIFDEMTLTLHEETWTYLGSRRSGKNKVSHDFEVKGGENLIITLSAKNKIRKVSDIKAATEFKARELKDKAN